MADENGYLYARFLKYWYGLKQYVKTFHYNLVKQLAETGYKRYSPT